MAKIQAYSSVSVVDLTDVGSINLYCTSNQPTSVIYDPDQNSYTPNWSSSPYLVITPVISYNGASLSLTASGLTITYQRREGSGTATTLTTGETVSGGILTVSANKLSTVSSGLLTYICNVQYTDPNTGVPISARSVLTYTLVSQAAKARYASISGETTFLYDTNRNIVGSNQITLTAELTNVSISQWQYKNSDGQWVAYPVTSGINDSNTGITLIIDASQSSIWLNGKNAVIKLVTSDNSIYDLHEIIKIYDGAAGESVVSAILSNENHYLPCESDGTVKSWNGASTEIHVYEGGVDVTSQWTITVVNGSGLSGTYDASTRTYTPSALTEWASSAEFTCKRTGYSDITKRYTITKQTSGADGEDAIIYEVVPDYYAMNLNEAGVFTPTAITFTAYKKVGESLTKSNYSGRFIISESTDGGDTFTAKYTSGSNEYQKVYTPSANTVNAIKCILYQAGGTTTQLDDQSIVITKDGKTGQDGNDGTDGLSIGLSNYNDVIPCNTSGNAIAARDITIPFYSYKGITRVPVTAVVGTLPTGVTIKSNTSGTTTSNGVLILTVASGATFGNSSLMTGDITITLTAEEKTLEQKYSWTKSKQAQDGTSAVILQLYSEDGGYVQVGKETTIKIMLTSGTDTVSPSSVKWYEFKNGGYQQIEGKTDASITIDDEDVTDQMWLKCEATYNDKTYTAYYTIDDTTDPYTAYTFATIEQFKNSQGYGAIYTRVYQNGTEVDPIKSTTFSNVAPTGASSGDFYYHLDTSNKTCVLKKYNGTQWVNATETDSFTYKYYRVNNAGTPLDTASAYKTDRCFYIDPSIIDGRMQFICEVSN